MRQLGAAAALSAMYLRWLAGSPDAGQFAPAAGAYDTISTGAKSFILKAARAVNAKKPLDASASLDDWARAWDTAIANLEQHAD